MKWQILTIGKPSLRYARDGIAEYEKRLKRYCPLTMRSVGREAGKEKNSTVLLQASEGSFRIAMDERGECPTTAEFARKIEGWQMDGAVKSVSLLIGGADGHSDELRRKADWVFAMSALTLQHELATVVLLEQIYRAHTLLRGEPYHR